MKLNEQLPDTRRRVRILTERSAAWVAFGTTTLLLIPTVSTLAAADQPEALEEIVVTGTRLGSGFTTPTPVSVIDASRLEERGATNIVDALNELPAFRASNTPATGELRASAGYVGGRILDLRGLGAVRTLTLVDGKRFVPSTTEATIDTNMIPSILLERAEVVTGGASAAYGSDAVAGVANLILDKKLTGLKTSVQGSISGHNDNADVTVGVAGGTQLSDSMHLLIGAEMERNRGTGDCQSRSWCRTETLNFGRNPGVTNMPANNILPDIRPSSTPFNGVTLPTGYSGTQPVLAPWSGITFADDGTPRRFQYGSMVNSLFMVGGQGQGENIWFKDLYLVAPTERYAVTGNLDWKIGDSTNASLMMNLGRLDGHYNSFRYRSPGFTLQATNPFIPRSTDPTLDLPTILAANGQTSFSFGKGFSELGRAPITTRNDLFRTVLSLDGKLFGSWAWDAYYQYGNNDFRSVTDNLTVTPRITKALNAVVNSSGQIVCAVNANASTADDDPACVAYNPFGQQASAAAKAYVVGTATQTNKTTEHVVAGNLRGAAFNLPAGPVAVAVGGEYRSDRVEGDVDAISALPAAQSFFTGAGSKISGKITVAEAYAESELPILAHLPFAQEFSFNGAVRRTEYQRSSSNKPSSDVGVTTWKLGVVWEPVDAVRFRATRSLDIRAPNISELFGPNTTISGILTDPANGGAQILAAVTSGANSLLKPEEANTLTVGVVFKPSGEYLSRLRASIDYYDIEIDDAISTLGQQNIVTRCFQGDAASCSLVTRNSNNQITQINDTLQNVNKLITRGVDFEVNYQQPLGGLGNADLRLLATWVQDLITVDAVGATQRAGQTGLRGGTPPGIPELVVDGMIGWSRDALSVNTHLRYIKDGFYNAAFVGAEQPGYNIAAGNSSNTNHVPSRTYVDLMARYAFDYGSHTHMTVFAGIDNVFNAEPPLSPGSHGTGNNLIFSAVGRSYKAGVRIAL